ncbi:PREDICTED: frataxin, mitochondrial [Tarenaya hassleriana]|uniref:frataxin, mitochondrial n=1 Tax=Tarenaya hassleriana TaxID=28532 RepID=UPI00053C84C6|nr:PREDICTED: frataxin, mitochondrial [Tarenaya hassleriana]
MAAASKLPLLRQLPRLLRLSHPAFLLRSLSISPRFLLASIDSQDISRRRRSFTHLDSSSGIRSFCSEGPASVDYRTLLREDEFHRLANSTIHDLLEKIEEYGDNVQIDGFDIDYGNEVLTVKLGSLGTYVLNKQTPNRQIWLSSPASGPSRFDWDKDSNSWVYRRTKANLLKLLEEELEDLCGKPITLS